MNETIILDTERISEPGVYALPDDGVPRRPLPRPLTFEQRG